MGRSVAVVCPKGGVGKTTVAVNLAAALADKGFKCLVVGVDPQCGVISSFGQERFSVDFGLLDFFDPDGSPARSIHPTGINNLDYITSNVWSRDEEEQLLTWAAISPESLSEGLAPVKREYDFIMLDCPPNLGPLTTSALMAADSLVVPLQVEELAFQALPRLFDAMDEMREGDQPLPELAGIVLNQVDLRTRMANSVTQRVREAYPGKVFETQVPRSIRLAEVAQRGKPVNMFNRAGAASQAFAALADELLANVVTEKRQEDRPAAPVEDFRESAFTEAISTLSKPSPVLTATGEILLSDDESEEKGNGKNGDDEIISLDEVEESDSDARRVTRPNLDEYDGGIEEGWH
jgi:chromosome partitioning protein